MPARRYTEASHLQGGSPMISSRRDVAPATTALREHPSAATSVPDLSSSPFSGADLEAGQITHAPPTGTTGSSAGTSQRSLPIFNLKDVGLTSVDCYFALIDPVGWVPKTWTNGKLKSTKSKSNKPESYRTLNRFLVCRLVNANAVSEAIAQAEGVPANTRSPGKPSTTSYHSKIMHNIWVHMTRQEQDVYEKHSQYLKWLYREKYAVKRNSEEEQLNADNDDDTVNGTSSPRAALPPKRTSRNRQRPRTSKRGAGTRADFRDDTSQNTFAHHGSSYPSSNAAGALAFHAISNAPQVQPHRRKPESEENNGTFVSRYPQAHHLDYPSPSAPTRNPSHSGHPYSRASVGGPSFSALVPSQSSYTASQPFTSGLSFASSSTIPRPSAPRRALQDITNVNRPANLDVLSPQISNGEQSYTVSNSAWLHRGLDSVNQEGVLPYTISNYSAHSNATASGMDSYPTFRTDDYILIDPQLLSLYNGETASMLGNADEVSQQGSYNHRH